MGHYDDIFEEREDKAFSDRAKSLGLTETELVAKDRHDAKMRNGKELYDKKMKEQELIDYYITHR